MTLERTRLRERDRDLEASHPYEVLFSAFKERRKSADTGQIVFKGKDLPWQQSRQGRSKYYLHIRGEATQALRDWYVFAKDIHTQSGRHTHQGGLVIYVTRGQGYSILDGEKLPWKPGSLMILPVKPGGVDHVHYNDLPEGESAQWIAFVFLPFLHATGSMLEQVQEQPNWRQAKEAHSEGG
jgi:hypothetical protein